MARKAMDVLSFGVNCLNNGQQRGRVYNLYFVPRGQLPLIRSSFLLLLRRFHSRKVYSPPRALF